MPSNTTVRGVGQGSLLTADPADPTHILLLAGVSDVRITDLAIDVITEIGQAGGIYFGSDQLDDLAMACERISVTGNVMSGTLREVASFIHGAICSTSRDWIIRGNTEQPAQANTRGILVAPRDADGVVQNLVIADNVMVGADLARIELRTTEGNGGADGFVIQGNTLERTRGIRVSGPVYRLGRVTGNVARDGFIYLWDCGPVDVHDNTVQTDSDAAVVLHTSSAASAVTASCP